MKIFQRKEFQMEMRDQGLKVPFLTPKEFGVVSAVVIFLILTAVLFAQPMTYPAKLDSVQIMPGPAPFAPGTKIIAHVYASGDSEKGPQGRDPDLWGLRAQVAEDSCRVWQLVVTDIVYHLGHDLAGVNSYFKPGTSERGVVLVKALDYNKVLKTLNDALLVEIEYTGKADAILYGLIVEQREDVKAIWGYVEKDRITLGVGANYTLIGGNEFFVPTVSLAYSRGMLGVEGEIGGGRAGNINSEKTLNGVWGANIFIRPCQFLKLGVGYQGTSRFFESDFTWYNRDDCFLGKAELEIPLSKKLSTNFTLGSLKTYDWGCYSRLSLSFNW
jgi:hypothetical protein